MWVMAGMVVIRQTVPHCLHELAGMQFSTGRWREPGL